MNQTYLKSELSMLAAVLLTALLALTIPPFLTAMNATALFQASLAVFAAVLLLNALCFFGFRASLRALQGTREKFALVRTLHSRAVLVDGRGWHILTPLVVNPDVVNLPAENPAYITIPWEQIARIEFRSPRPGSKHSVAAIRVERVASQGPIHIYRHPLRSVEPQLIEALRQRFAGPIETQDPQ